MTRVSMHVFWSDVDWDTVYQTLTVSVKYWVYEHVIPSWRGQEEDIVDDIVQEAVVRVLKYIGRHREQGQGEPVKSFPGFCRTVALNYGKDLQRHDRRLDRADTHEQSAAHLQEVIEDLAIEYLYLKDVLVLIARTIKRFPKKQRAALLTDIAHHADFYEDPTALQEAFRQAGIQLEEYQQSFPQEPAERNKYFSLLNSAYKRLKGAVPASEGLLPLA